MNNFILLFLLITTAVADNKIVLFNNAIYQHANYKHSSYKGDVKTTEDIIQNRFKLMSSGSIFKRLNYRITGVVNYTNMSDEYKSIILQNKEINNYEYYLNTAYLEYKLTSNLYFLLGLVSFEDGSYIEASELGNVQGAGLNKLIDTPMEAVFFIYKSSYLDYSIISKLGYGEYDASGIDSSNILSKGAKGTNGVFLNIDISKDYDTIKFNYYHVNYKQEDIDVGHIELIGLGFNKYDIGTGINIYSTVGYSLASFNHNLIKLKDAYKLDPYLTDVLFNKSFNFNANKSTGYMGNLGISKDIDSYLVESYNIGAEYTHTSKHWTNLINNDLKDNPNLRYVNGEAVHMWMTTKFTPDIGLKLSYSHVYNRYARNKGLITGVVDHKYSIDDQLVHLNSIAVKLMIRY